MEAKELRIGNLIDNDGVFIETDRYIIKNSNMPSVWEHYKPIPLTEEWLVKFGFKDDYITFELNGFMLGWYKDDNFYYLPTNEIIKRHKLQIKYVHQLQNLYFAITGEELEIHAPDL